MDTPIDRNHDDDGVQRPSDDATEAGAIGHDSLDTAGPAPTDSTAPFAAAQAGVAVAAPERVEGDSRLWAEGLTKAYRKRKVVDDVHIEVFPGILRPEQEKSSFPRPLKIRTLPS